MNSGEILIGEIKTFDEGVITIETGYSDSDFKVEWDKVTSIITNHKFLVITTKGNRHYGKLSSDKNKPDSVVIDDIKKGKSNVSINDIVYLKQIEDTFWSRVDLSLSVGYTLAKANNSHQLSGNISTSYLSSVFKTDLYGKIMLSLQTTDKDTLTISRTQGGLGFLFFIVKDWFAVVRTDLLQSSEQKLNIRAITKGGFGNYVVKTNRMNLGIAGGGAWNYEDYNDSTTIDRNSLEAFVAVQYNIFNIGDLDLLTSVVAYPSLTESGRFRTDFSFNLEYEFVLDFFVNLGFTLNYDNQPAAGASPADYVFQTTIGWKL